MKRSKTPKERATSRASSTTAERVPMSFRVTPEFKGRLDGWAAASGRSLAQEIELRLEQSDRSSVNLLREALELAYGSQGAGLLLLIAKVLQGEVLRSGGHLDSDWLNDRTIFDRVVAAINQLFMRIEPEGDARDLPGETPQHAVDRLFIGLADETFFPMAPWRTRMTELLGSAAMERVRRRTPK
jgi:hypothetical protein